MLDVGATRKFQTLDRPEPRNQVTTVLKRLRHGSLHLQTLDWLCARRKGEYFITSLTRGCDLDPRCTNLGVSRPLVSSFS